MMDRILPFMMIDYGRRTTGRSLRRFVRSVLLGGIAIMSLGGSSAVARDGVSDAPQRAHIGETNQLVMGSFAPRPADFGLETTIFGASKYTDSWPVAILHNSEGKTYFIILGHRRDGESFLSIWVNTPDPSGNMPIDPRLPKIGKRPLNYRYDGATDELRYTAEGTGVDSAEITIGEKEMSWKQAGVMDLHGVEKTPGIFVYLPWRNESLSGVETWNAVKYLASGTLFGEPVTGFLHISRNFDTVPYSEGAITRVLHGMSLQWTNLYGDGSMEQGVFRCGQAGLQGAVVVNSTGRELAHTNDVGIQIHWTPDKHITGADLRIGKELWKLTPAANATIVRPPPSIVSVNDGLMVRKNESRKVVRNWMTIEADPTKMCVPPPQ